MFKKIFADLFEQCPVSRIMTLKFHLLGDTIFIVSMSLFDNLRQVKKMWLYEKACFLGRPCYMSDLQLTPRMRAQAQLLDLGGAQGLPLEECSLRNTSWQPCRDPQPLNVPPFRLSIRAPFPSHVLVECVSSSGLFFVARIRG